MPELDIRHALALAQKGIAEGARRPSVARLVWDKATRCEAARTLEFTARSYIDVPGPDRTFLLDIDVPCRKCDPCRRGRSTLWWLRSRMECRQAERNWFGTLTLAPDKHHLMLSRARARLIKMGTDFDSLDHIERFALHHAEISRELTLWLKRVRKVRSRNSGIYWWWRRIKAAFHTII